MICVAVSLMVVSVNKRYFKAVALPLFNQQQQQQQLYFDIKEKKALSL